MFGLTASTFVTLISFIASVLPDMQKIYQDLKNNDEFTPEQEAQLKADLAKIQANSANKPDWWKTDAERGEI